MSPVPEVKNELLQKLVVNLASDNFALRQTAQKELKEMGETITVFLQQTKKNNPSLEVNRRIDLLLEAARTLPPETLRQIRAIQVLELISSPNAQEVLGTLAKGFPGALVTKNAKESLDRLAKRPTN